MSSPVRAIATNHMRTHLIYRDARAVILLISVLRTLLVRHLCYRLLACCLAAWLSFPLSAFAQGPLAPPGGPTPSMKSLDQVEPRIPIDATHTAGDSGTQFVISQQGSYYLTSNITGVSGKDGISIRSDNVTVDLRGFAMVGAGGGFSGSAIIVPSAHKNLCVANGVIQGWGSTAVLMFNATASRVENLRVSDSGGSGVLIGDDSTAIKCSVVNSGAYGVQVGTGGIALDCIVDGANNGISTGDKSAVSGCLARACGNSGFVMGSDCSASRCQALNNSSYGFSSGVNGVFTDCTARGNLNDGFSLGDGSKLTGCVAATNTGANTDGIRCQNNCAVHNCTATSNGGFGISLNLGGSIANCSARSNGGDGITIDGYGVILGCTASSNTGVGLGCTTGCVINNCTATSNTADGINVNDNNEVAGNICWSNGPNNGTVAGIHATSGGNRIENNTVTSNNNRGLKVDSAGNFIVRNSATGNSINYDIAANNKVGTIVAAPNSLAISGSTGGAGVGTTDPWANFSY